MHGILLVDKPEGITSNRLVGAVKKLVRPAKVGHSGTLDPAASGLMVVLIGQGTRTLDYLDESRKEYRLTVRLGEETDTDDREGKVIRTGDPSGIAAAQIEEALESYRGVLDQVPPRYSALKRNGVPLYKLARQGIEIDVPARKVEVFSLILKKWAPPLLNLEMICSKGTYARSIARDLGRDLDVGGRLESLRRTAGGPFKVEDALPLDDITFGGREVIEENLIALPEALAHIPELSVFPLEVRRLMRGTSVNVPRSRLAVLKPAADRQPRLFKIVTGDGDLVILVRPQPKGADISLLPVRVFNTLSDQ